MAKTAPPSKSKDLDKLLLRPGNLVSPYFKPSIQLRDDLQEYVKVLVVGARGLECELPKDLAKMLLSSRKELAIDIEVLIKKIVETE